MSTETERKEDKTMTNPNDARRAHDVLDGLSAGRILSKENEQLLRSFLPEMPKQKTLEEILEEVESAACSVTDSYWSPSLNPQDWLWELHAQLKGLKDTPAAVPALPTGMRLAVHKDYGRVVTSPKPDQDGVYVLLISTPKVETGADWEYAHECELTFIDTEPAKPAHPEFLQTGAEYQEAPWGTIVAMEDSLIVWVKKDDSWSSTDGERRTDSQFLWGVPRKVLRWGENA